MNFRTGTDHFEIALAHELQEPNKFVPKGIYEKVLAHILIKPISRTNFFLGIKKKEEILIQPETNCVKNSAFFSLI